jgi:hypothetical protein
MATQMLNNLIDVKMNLLNHYLYDGSENTTVIGFDQSTTDKIREAANDLLQYDSIKGDVRSEIQLILGIINDTPCRITMNTRRYLRLNELRLYHDMTVIRVIMRTEYINKKITSLISVPELQVARKLCGAIDYKLPSASQQDENRDNNLKASLQNILSTYENSLSSELFRIIQCIAKFPSKLKQVFDTDRILLGCDLLYNILLRCAHSAPTRYADQIAQRIHDTWGFNGFQKYGGKSCIYRFNISNMNYIYVNPITGDIMRRHGVEQYVMRSTKHYMRATKLLHELERMLCHLYNKNCIKRGASMFQPSLQLPGDGRFFWRKPAGEVMAAGYRKKIRNEILDKINQYGPQGEDDRQVLVPEFVKIESEDEFGMVISDRGGNFPLAPARKPRVVQVIVTDSSTGERHHIQVPPRFGDPDSKTYQKYKARGELAKAALAWSFDIPVEEYVYKNMIQA